jgi:hypothetical protein
MPEVALESVKRTRVAVQVQRRAHLALAQASDHVCPDYPCRDENCPPEELPIVFDGLEDGPCGSQETEIPEDYLAGLAEELGQVLVEHGTSPEEDAALL